MDRIDRVVLRLDYDLRTMGVRVLAGVPGATPQPPALTRNNHVYELSLAQVKIRAGAVSVSPADIEDERFNGNVCGIVTHLFEDANAIFSYFQNEWEKWFSEIEDTTNLVPRSEAFLFMSIPQFQQAVQNPFFMEQMAQQFLALDVITSNPTAMDIIASSEVAMEAVAASEVAMEAVVQSEVAIEAVAASEVAMEAVAASEVAMEAVVQSEVAMAAIGQVSMAIGKLAAGLAGLDPRDYADITAVAASEVAMEAVAASEVALSAIFDSWLARLAIWKSEMASQTIMQQARAWLEANVAEVAYRQSNSTEFAMVVDKKGLLLAIRHDYNTGPADSTNGEMRVFAQAPTARSYTDIVGGSLLSNTWYNVAYRMENFQVKNRQSAGAERRLDFRYVPMEP